MGGGATLDKGIQNDHVYHKACLEYILCHYNNERAKAGDNVLFEVASILTVYLLKTELREFNHP